MIEIETEYDNQSCVLKIKIPNTLFGSNQIEKVQSLVHSIQIFMAGYLGLAKVTKETNVS